MSEQSIAEGDLTRALPDPADAENVIYDPTLEQLRAFSRDMEVTSQYGSPAYVSEQRSRSADRTKNAVDQEFTRADYAHVEDAIDVVSTRDVVCLDRRMGRHPDHACICRLFVPREYGRIALAWGKLFEPVESDDVEPDLITIQVPEWDETAIRILPDAGFTAVLGSDYTGEAKKSFLRLFMFRAKQQGGLGLHAGSKRVTLERDGDSETVGQLFLGLSGTGKSTLTAHGLGLSDPEGVTMLQDDVCALLPDGSVAGSEGQGLYIKTIGLDPDEQPELHDTATAESAVLENVDVAEDGTVDFDSDRYTTNGRAVVQRSELDSAGDDIDLPSVDQVFFITRNPLMPPVAKLDPDEAAAAFMLGESVQTSAGDPSAAGDAIRVVGTNPFIIGSPGEEGNRFRDLIGVLSVDCFVLNTGSVGDRDVGVEDTVTLLRAISRGTVQWRDDETTGLTVPAAVPGLDVERFDVARRLDDAAQSIEDLRADRRSYLEGFTDLDEEITAAVY